MDVVTEAAVTVDLAVEPVRTLNADLHQPSPAPSWRVLHPAGAHNVAVGVDAPVDVEIDGPVGYYCAGMNQQARVLVRGNAGTGLAENIMSGKVRVTGSASQSVAAAGVGGLVVVDGDTGARCGIALRGADVVVGGDVGHMTAFMAQAGRLVVCGDAGHSLGDSIYEARLYVRGAVASLGTDCVEKPMRDEHRAELAELLARAGRSEDPAGFRRYGSSRRLYHFDAANAAAY